MLNLANIAKVKKIGKGHLKFFCVKDNGKLYSKKTTRGIKAFAM
jgi:hypothetical protein